MDTNRHEYLTEENEGSEDFIGGILISKAGREGNPPLTANNKTARTECAPYHFVLFVIFCSIATII